jgi:hypothetical protein
MSDDEEEKDESTLQEDFDQVRHVIDDQGRLKSDDMQSNIERMSFTSLSTIEQMDYLLQFAGQCITVLAWHNESHKREHPETDRLPEGTAELVRRMLNRCMDGTYFTEFGFEFGS